MILKSTSRVQVLWRVIYYCHWRYYGMILAVEVWVFVIWVSFLVLISTARPILREPP